MTEGKGTTKEKGGDVAGKTTKEEAGDILLAAETPPPFPPKHRGSAGGAIWGDRWRGLSPRSPSRPHLLANERGEHR